MSASYEALKQERDALKAEYAVLRLEVGRLEMALAEAERKYNELLDDIETAELSK